jgi:two-component system chemotaxis response regulator CheY
MPTKVLIVDEAAGVRTMLARILRSLDCETVEAFDGGAALEMLEKGEFHAAIFDMDTPLLSGLELLQAVRTSSRYSMLPVVMITDGADHNTVAEAVRHGASECLTRPFNREKIRTRLQRIIKVAPQLSGASKATAAGGDELPSALIVDRNADFRHFVANVLMSSYSTMQAEDGVQALRICGLRRQSVLVLGDDTGIMGPHVLARRLKKSPALADMRIVLVAPKEAAGDVIDASAFDAILTRTFVPAEFAQQFEQIVGKVATAPGRTVNVIDDVRENAVSATEQVLGMMASATVALVDEGRAPLPPSELEAFTVMTLQTHGADVRFALSCDLLTAKRLGAQMTGLAESEVGAEDAQSGLSEIVNVICGRLKAAVTRAGESVSYTIPETRSIDPAAPPVATDVTLEFASNDQKLALRVLLTEVRAASEMKVPAEASITT